MRALVRSFDTVMRRRMGVVEFTDDPDCIFRVRMTTTPRPIDLPGVRAPAGTPTCELHFWNDQLPTIPDEGTDFGWGIRGHRVMVRSLRMLAAKLRDDPELSRAELVSATTVLLHGRDTGADRLFTKLGFEATPQQAGGPASQFFENVHSWMMMWAYNAGTLRGRDIFTLRRTEIWQTRERFLALHAR